MPTTTTVSSSAGLVSALKSAQAGDTILLAPGAYGDVSISGVKFASDVIIRSADTANPAEFRSLAVTNSSGLSIQAIDVEFTPTMQTLEWTSAVAITNSSRIALIGSEVSGGPAINGVAMTAASLDSTYNVKGMPTGRGISVSDSSGILIQNVDVSVFNKGVVLQGVSNITLQGNEIHHTRTSPISGTNISNVTIDRNHIHDVTPWKWNAPVGDHADFIHFWTDPAKATSATSGLVITNNRLEQGQGTAILGVFLEDNTAGLGYAGVVIRGNVIHNGNHQGLYLENVRGVVDGNVLLQTSGELKIGPGLVLSGSSLTGLTITENVISGLDLGKLAGDSRGNVLVQSVSPTLANYSGNPLGDVLTWTEALEIRARLTGTVATTGPAPGESAGLAGGATQPVWAPAPAPAPAAPPAPAPSPIEAPVFDRDDQPFPVTGNAPVTNGGDGLWWSNDNGYGAVGSFDGGDYTAADMLINLGAKFDGADFYF